jgi:formate dehydrogenase subunit gamma
MQWFGHFPVSWRTGATFVHDVFALAVFVVVFGHIAFAITHPGSMRSMIKGWVTDAWAARHADGWLEEERGEEGSGISR